MVNRKDIKSNNGLVFFVSNLAKNWNISSPYPLALKNLLLGLNPKGRLQNLRVAQEYHFVSKVIDDEIGKDSYEIGKNCSDIKKRLERFTSERDSIEGSKIMRLIFHIVIMNLLKHHEHFKRIDKGTLKEFLDSYNTDDLVLAKFKSIIVLLTQGVKESNISKSNSIVEHALDLLYLRMIISNESTSNKDDLIGYYLNQSTLEGLDLGQVGNDNAKAELLMFAIIIKAASGEGLYIPEPEKEKYLSSFAKDLIRNKYMKILRDASSFRIKIFKVIDFKLPLWACLGLIFLIETLIFVFPKIAEIFSAADVPVIGQITKATLSIAELPIWIIIAINGAVVGLLLYIHQKYLYKKFSVI